MLRLLTDEQISPAVAERARAACGKINITSLRDWHGGHMLGATDELLLEECHRGGLTLVTYDLRSIPPLLRRWAEDGVDHGGVVLVDHKTIKQKDVGGLTEALCLLWRAERRADWSNRVVFLQRPGR